MIMNKIALAFCEENKERAEATRKNLEPSGLSFEMVQLSKSRPDIQLTEVLQSITGPIILLVSDNFLKSTQCLAGGLRFLQDKKEQLLPIVLDGYQENDAGQMETVSTQFDRVSDIIQYINFWQDRYLSMRRQKRQLPNIDEDTFNIHLKNMRDISTEVGEYLRILRSIDHYTIEQFEANDYQLFFIFLEQEALWETFKNSRPKGTAETMVAVTDSTEEELQVDEENAPIDVMDIPGIKELEHAASEPIEDTVSMEPPAEQENLPLEEVEMHQGEASPENTQEDAPAFILAEEGFSNSDSENSEENTTAEIQELTEEEVAISEEEDPIPIEETLATQEHEEEEEEEEEEVAQPDLEEVHQEETPTLLTTEALEQLVDESWERAEAGDVDGGLNILTTALEQPKHSAILHYHIAVLNLQYKNDLQTAQKHLKTLLEHDENNIGGHFLSAELEEMAENFVLARYHYERVDQLSPNYSETNLRLGTILAHHYPDEANVAEQYLTKALNQNPDNGEVVYEMGLLYADVLQQPLMAIKYLKKTLKKDPNHAFANYDLALLYHRQGKLKKAFKYYQLATVVNPELKTPENDMAFTFDPKKNTEFSAIEHDAITSLKKNIDQLESLLMAREQEASKLAAQRDGFGKTVLISGATSGIGKATAEIFAKNGFRVLITGRREERLEEIKEYLTGEYNTEVQTLTFDIRDQDAVKANIEALAQEWQEIDILINNAGKAKGYAPIHEGELEHWEEMIDTNIKGLLYLTRAVSPGMVARQKGHIINVSSSAGKEVYPNGNVYCATKFAVEALTKATRLDLYQHKIRVSQVSPGHVEETEFAFVRFDGDAEKAQIYNDFKPLTSSDVADSIYYIATRPEHVNVQDISMMSTQQASNIFIDRSGRGGYEEEE
ncbi:MAG: hypothetical protein DHS20C18_36030 [Saprospiraceae bacterium]|nr:MAG: hypothetical protein DHS20C18_36030 [Saprospiraceae bacterium]